MSLENISLRVKNFKCFGQEGGGFLEIKPLNLIIGRNNSGKSSLLDLITHAVANKFSEIPSDTNHNNKTPVFEFSKPLEEGDLAKQFGDRTTGGEIPRGYHLDFAKKIFFRKKDYL